MEKRREAKELLQGLHSHFGSNINSLTPAVVTLIDRIDLYSRVTDEIRVIILRLYCNGDKQKISCAELLGEIFSDFSQAMYLFSVGLIVPARMLIRRALELGLAFLYMWDMPHEYWGWAEHGDDLSFTGMIEHLSSPKYATHLANVRGTLAFNQRAIREMYRSLSETVHGKHDDLPPLSPRRFDLVDVGIDKHLQLTINVQRSLVDMWCGRFCEIRELVDKQFPQPLWRN
jgi:hypothetical protein